MKAWSDCVKFPLKTTEEEETASLAALNELGVDAAGAAVLSELDGMLALKD